MSPPPEATSGPDAYFLEIEAHFAARRGTPFVFSAKDWALMKSWREEGIPLPVVLEAIDGCFAKREAGGRGRTVSSLSYCRHAVRELWSDRKDLQVGATGAVPETDAPALLGALASRLEERAEGAGPSAPPLRDAARAIRAIRLDSVPHIEDELSSIEQTLIDGLLSSLPEADRRELTLEVDGALAAHRLSGAAAERTRAANLRRLVRRRFDLPRLSLFA